MFGDPWQSELPENVVATSRAIGSEVLNQMHRPAIPKMSKNQKVRFGIFYGINPSTILVTIGVSIFEGLPDSSGSTQQVV